MEFSEKKRFVYEFGKFVLDPREKTLLIDGQPIHLPAKEFETLLILVENNGHALTKEEMMSAVWQDAFVEEGNLAKQVSKLRKVLNSNGEQLIETVPKHGYRFSADYLRRVDVDDDSPVILEKRTVRRLKLAFDNTEGDRHALPPARRKFPPAALGLVGILLLIAVGMTWYWLAYRRSSEIKSIAVLPMRSLSGDETDALALGLTDSLITELGSLRPLLVRPIGAVRGFSNSNEDALELGRKLNVDAVLEGTIQHASGRIRINARLISTANGEQIWAEKFDDTQTNMFDVQDRLSEQAARALVAMLGDRPVSPPNGRLTKRYTENSAAFDAYLKGRYHWNKRSEADFQKAIEYFEQAVALDPHYALAYSGLADAHVLLAVWGTEPPRSSMEQAKQAALKALAVDPELAEALTSLAFVEWVYDWDFTRADADFTRALDLNPNYATAHHWRAYYLVSNGRGEEAIAAIKRARELEGPLSPGIMTDIGEIYCWAGRCDEAVSHLAEITKLDPNYAVAHFELGIAYLKTNRPQDAIAELERANELESEPRIVSALAYVYGVVGESAKARELIAKMEADSAARYVSPFSIAIAHAGLGDEETAIDWLEKAKAERSDAMAILKVHPLLLQLHSNPRFVKLAREVGFAE